jgi:hypothetical protein
LKIHRTIPTLGFLLFLLGLFVSGCVPLATDTRKEGFQSFEKSFVSLDESPSLNEMIDLGGVKVHIVGQRQFFNIQQAKAYGSPVVGYATSNNEIWVFGRTVKGKVMVNQAVLGHELMHLLQFKNPRVADPDKLDDLGA